MNRRIIIFIIACILILGTVGGVLFFFAQKQNTPVVEEPQLSIKKVLDEPVISPISSAINSNSIWYFNTEGRLFKANTDGSNLSEFPLPTWSSSNLRRVLWPKTGSDFIAVGSDGLKSFYDSQSKIFIKLPANIQYLDWMPDSKRIVYVWRANDGKTQQIATSDADGSGYRPIASVFWPDLIVKASSDGKTVLMYRGNIQDVNKIYSLDLQTTVITTLVDTGKNDSAAWLPTGDKFLFTQGSEVLLYNMADKKVSILGLSATLDRIAMDSSGQYIYAATTKADNSGDEFVKVDLSSLKTVTYFIPSTEVRVKNLILVGNSLFYTDSKDGKFYTVGK